MEPWLPPYSDRSPPGCSAPPLVVRSMMPALRRPYSAGRLPVISFIDAILGGVRHLQHDLVQLHIVPARGRLDVFGIEGVGGGSRLGIDTRALLVQMLRGDDDGGQIGAGLVGDLRERGHRGTGENRCGECSPSD